MGKSFKISGSFIDNGVVTGLFSSFDGEVAIDEDHLYGVCNATDDPNGNTYYYLSGDVATNINKTTSAIFYRFSYGSIKESLKFVVPDLKIPNLSAWARPDGFGLFQYQGQADVRLEDLPHPYILKYKITDFVETVDEDIGNGTDLLEARERYQKITNGIAMG